MSLSLLFRKRQERHKSQARKSYLLAKKRRLEVLPLRLAVFVTGRYVLMSAQANVSGKEVFCVVDIDRASLLGSPCSQLQPGC